MRSKLLLAGFLLLINSRLLAQIDLMESSPFVESIVAAEPRTATMSINLSDPEETDLALKDIHKFKYLQSVIIEGSGEEATLKKLLYRISALKNLTNLTLKDNELSSLPENISLLKSLRSLTIEGNTGLDFVGLFNRMKSLLVKELNLIDNDLVKVPDNLSQLQSLEKVQISGSAQADYEKIIDQLARLPALRTLAIPVNYITELPKNIAALKSLRVLDVSHNDLTELPSQISALKTINNLSIQGNLLLDPTKDLEKLKSNKIEYLALDKEISGDELEKIKKMFPDAQVDFPVNKEKQDPVSTTNDLPAMQPVYSGNLTAKKHTGIYSGAYLMYPAMFQSLVYNFDTLNFEERYRDLRYNNIYQARNATADVIRGGGQIYLRKRLLKYELGGKRHETWFRLPNEMAGIDYLEIRTFSGMYWIYQGDLSKKQFRKMYLKKRIRPQYRNIFGWKKIKRKSMIFWNDLRIDFDKNNSMFVIRLKTDTGFVSFKAYPVFPTLSQERSNETYYRMYQQYKKMVQRRSANFARIQAKNKRIYDQGFLKLNESAWKALQSRMSDEEKLMKREDWMNYYDGIIINEQQAIDKTPLTTTYILRSLTLQGYTVSTNTGTLTVTPPNAGRDRRSSTNYQLRSFGADFVNVKDTGKLAVSGIYIIDNRNKQVYPGPGTLGLLPNDITLKQFASYTILVCMRNGDWGSVSSGEIDSYIIEPYKTYKFRTTVFDKNLDTVGDLLKRALE